MANRIDHPADLLGSGAVGRHQDDHVADGAGQDAELGQGFADADAGALAQVERLAGAPVADQFDAGDQADLADVADVGASPQGLEFVAQGLRQALAGANRGGGLEDFQAGQGRRRAELVGGEAVAVEEGLELVVFAEEGVEDRPAW